MGRRLIVQTELGVRNLVDSIIVDELGCERERLLGVADLQRDLGADSLDMIELVMAIEAVFDITIPDVDADRIRTVGDLRNYVVTRVL